MSLIRILHCTRNILAGGVERQRVSLFERLPAQRFEHRVICAELHPGVVADVIRDRGIAVTEVGETASVFAARRYRMAAEVIRAWRPHIVHGAIIEGYTLAGVGRVLARVPIVVMEETSDPQGRSWRGHLLTRAMAGLADGVIAVSPGVEAYLRRLRVPAAKLALINNGVEQPRVVSPAERRAVRGELGLAEDDLVIGTVGRADDETKRYSDLFEAVRLLVPEFGRLKLLVVGDGPDLAMLRERAAATAALRGRVVFAGYQQDVAPYYAQMDVFALASQREAFGLVLAEAMRCELPVVATRVGGIPYVVEDGQTGLLVPKLDPPALAGALRQLLSDPERRRRMGAAGKVRADREFSAERYVEDVRQLYERLLRDKGIVQ